MPTTSPILFSNLEKGGKWDKKDLILITEEQAVANNLIKNNENTFL